MKARFYTFLFAILPRRWQSKLWSKLADDHGYHGRQTTFGNGAYFIGTTKRDEDDLFKKLREHALYGGPREGADQEKAAKIDHLIDFYEDCQ